LLYAENNKEEVSNIVESSSHAHVEIAEALLAGDQARTEKAVAAHLRDVEARMLEKLT
jgi:DNA-binding GntR family transcriptional regulator